MDSVSIVKPLTFVAFLGLGLTVAGLPAESFAQSAQSAEWPTGSFNPQRDAWQRNENKLSVDNAPNIRLLWKLKTDNKTMGMQSFREPLILAAQGKTFAIPCWEPG